MKPASSTSTVRTTLQELREIIEKYRAIEESEPGGLRSANVRARIRGYESDAWEAAYKWHLGITEQLRIAAAQQDPLGWAECERERIEGNTMIRDRLG